MGTHHALTNRTATKGAHKMNTYQRGKAAVRAQAIQWQADFPDRSKPWAAIAAEQIGRAHV